MNIFSYRIIHIYNIIALCVRFKNNLIQLSQVISIQLKTFDVIKCI